VARSRYPVSSNTRRFDSLSYFTQKIRKYLFIYLFNDIKYSIHFCKKNNVTNIQPLYLSIGRIKMFIKVTYNTKSYNKNTIKSEYNKALIHYTVIRRSILQ